MILCHFRFTFFHYCLFFPRKCLVLKYRVCYISLHCICPSKKKASASHCVMAAYRQPCHCGKLIPLCWHHPSPGDIHISYSFLVADGSFSCIAECAIRFTLGEVNMHLSYALWAFKFLRIFMVAKKLLFFVSD